jgi:hypothetical protein
MDVSPVSPVSSGSAALLRWSQLHEEVRLPTPPTTPGPAAPTAADAGGGVRRDGVVVEVARHRGTGAQTVTVTDARTGAVLAQLPPEKVLEVVAGLLEQQRRMNETRGDHGQR